jgi:hypothetical protein
MKVLIEHKRTGKFLAKLGGWTTDYRKAKHFKQSISAIDYVVKEKLVEVYLLLVFSTDRRMDVRLDSFAIDKRLEPRAGSGSIELMHNAPSRAVG